MFRKKTWWNKKTQKWNGRDMFKATLTMTGIVTLLSCIPIIGVWIKEELD
jgi:hypothetical protein